MLPQDPIILLSYVNTKLRDEYASLSALCGGLDVGETELAQKLAALLCGRKGLSVEAAEAVSHAAYQQTQLDLLADGVRQALDMEKIYRIMEGS